MDGLTAGTLVHVVVDEGDHLPGLVTKILHRGAGRVNVLLFADSLDRTAEWGGDTFLHLDVGYSDEKELDTWHWIERR